VTSGRGGDPELRPVHGGFTNLVGVLRAFGEGRIFGESHGDGPVQVVWLHGWARTSADFAVAGALLAHEGVASVALDLPGFGASPLPARAGGAPMYADLVEPVLGEIGPGPLVLVGHSFGGRVATMVAATYPQRVRALVLTGVPLVHLSGSRRSPWAYRVVRALHSRGAISDAKMESARQKYGSNDYRRATGLLRDILVASVNEDYASALARIGAPVDLVWGADDHVVPLEVARRAREIMVHSPHVELDVLAETGHLLPTERPGELVAHAQQWVSHP
jgi:pimeloyl-ACP methyl ester carboxylesterase